MSVCVCVIIVRDRKEKKGDDSANTSWVQARKDEVKFGTKKKGGVMNVSLICTHTHTHIFQNTNG